MKYYKYLFSIYLIGFTGYILFDSFLDTKVYETVDNNIISNISEENKEGKYTSNSYSDDNMNIVIKTITAYNTKVYIADITLSDSKYLKTAFANNAYGKNITDYTSSMAENNGAIIAVNGDYYGVQSNGYVLKNYVLYRSTSAKDKEDLVIYGDGTFEIINESEISAEELVSKGAKEILSFGPALIKDGNINVTKTTEVGKAMASNPRTAIGIIDDNHYVLVVSDGRTNESEGLSLYELALVMQEYGVKTLYNLDGGGSSTMYFNGTIVNNPTTNGKISERKVSDIVYIGY